jgi:hypothetical protein
VIWKHSQSATLSAWVATATQQLQLANFTLQQQIFAWNYTRYVETVAVGQKY